MDLTPDLLLEAKFAPARRGYDMNEVDDFLERCAEGLDVLLARLRSEFERAERAEAALAEVRAGGDATVLAPPVEAVAEAPPAAVEPAPVAEPEPARVEEPMRILIAAERTAEAAIADARAEAERIRAEAESVASTTRSEAETLLARSRAEAEAEARKAGEETRRSIEAEVLALREDRDLLSEDVRSLRSWLDEQRSRLRTTARDLQRLVDDPDALRELPVPEIHADADLVSPTTAEGTDEVAGQTSIDEIPAPTDAVAADEADQVVDARTADDVQARLDGSIFDAHGGEPTQAVPAVGATGTPSMVFDDEQAPTGDHRSFFGSDAIR